MRFGQLIENNMKNHTQNVVEKLVKDPFLMIQIPLGQQTEML